MLYVPACEAPSPFVSPGPFTAEWKGVIHLDLRDPGLRVRELRLSDPPRVVVDLVAAAAPAHPPARVADAPAPRPEPAAPAIPGAEARAPAGDAGTGGQVLARLAPTHRPEPDPIRDATPRAQEFLVDCTLLPASSPRDCSEVRGLQFAAEPGGPALQIQAPARAVHSTSLAHRAQLRPPRTHPP